MNFIIYFFKIPTLATKIKFLEIPKIEARKKNAKLILQYLGTPHHQALG